MPPIEFRNLHDFLQYLIDNHDVTDNFSRPIVTNMSKGERLRFFRTNDIDSIIRSIPNLLIENVPFLTLSDDEDDEDDDEKIIPKNEILEGIEITKSNMKTCKENLKDYEKDLQIARELSETKKDLDILFDYLDENLPFKDFWNIQIDIYKKYYFILISMLHKKTDGLLQKIDEIRPLFHEFDEKMTRLLKQNHLWFIEQNYIDYSLSSKFCILNLDNFVECINGGYEIE